MTYYFSENSEIVDNVFRNSGKDYNDLGRYEDCLNVTDFHYVLASVPNVFPIPMSLGLCVPSICSLDDFKNFKPYLVKMLNAMIPVVFEGIKGFDLSVKVTESDMFFEDSKEKNKEATRASAGSWIVVLLIIFFTLAVLISSFAAWYF